MASKNDAFIFTGREHLNKFVTKYDLYSILKGYEGEKKAAFIAGRHEEPAFDIYIGLSAADQNDPEKIKAVLLSSSDQAKPKPRGSDRTIEAQEMTTR